MRCKDFKLLINGNIIRGKIFSPSETYNKALGSVILCHGIPGGKKDPKDPGYSQLAKILSEAGYQAVTFKFRGAGESTGDFDIVGWVKDLKAVLNYICSTPDCSPWTVLISFSAGAAVAVYTGVHDNRIAGLILCGCPADFDSILLETGANQFLQHARDVGIIKTPGFPPDLSEWIKGFQVVRPETWIGHINSASKLILHGDGDEVVSVDHAYRLYEKAQEPKDLLIIKNGGHRLRLNEEAMKAALEWLNRKRTEDFPP